MSSVPSDLFSSADVSGLDADLGDSGAEAETFESDAPEIAEPEAEVPVEEPAEEPAAEEDPPAEEAAPEATDDLPEGVKAGKDRNGKPGYFLDKPRWEKFHGDHRTLRDFEAAIGEPITADSLGPYGSLGIRNRAYMGQERLYNDITSGDPAAQGKVIVDLFTNCREAQEAGYVKTNPIVPLAQEFYKQVKADPDAYASLRYEAANDLINELYQEAGAKQDSNLWRSAGWVAKNLGLSFKPDAEMQNFAAQQSDPMAQAKQRIQELESQVNGRAANEATAQFQSWQRTTAQSNTQALREEALLPSISDEQQAAWQKFPTQFENLVVAPLNKAVREHIAGDRALNERVNMLSRQAERATSAQARAQIAADMKSLFVNRARIAADALKGPILREAANLLKQQNDKTHQRRNAAQSQRTPQGSSSSVPRSLVPGSVTNERAGTVFDPKQALQDMSALLR